MGTPLKNQNFEKRFSACQRGPKNRPRAKMSCTQVLKWQRLWLTTEKGAIFNTGPYGDPPLKILKSGFLHAREDQKIGPEPKCHVPRSSNGKDQGEKTKRGQFLTLDHMGTPLKNQNFENRASSCVKLAKIKPRAKIP